MDNPQEETTVETATSDAGESVVVDTDPTSDPLVAFVNEQLKDTRRHKRILIDRLRAIFVSYRAASQALDEQQEVSPIAEEITNEIRKLNLQRLYEGRIHAVALFIDMAFVIWVRTMLPDNRAIRLPDGANEYNEIISEMKTTNCWDEYSDSVEDLFQCIRASTTLMEIQSQTPYHLVSEIPAAETHKRIDAFESIFKALVQLILIELTSTVVGEIRLTAVNST